MIDHGLYFGKASFYDLIRDSGGKWTDSKERPLVCMLKSIEHEGLYWAIPIGNWDHRSAEAKARINKFLSCDEKDLRSCYYHVGNTDVKSIFFISDVVPIKDEYIDREYLNRYTKTIYVIQNKQMIAEIDRKLRRILAFEKQRPNYFRQHISDLISVLTTAP